MKRACKRYTVSNTELGNMQMLFDGIWSVNQRQRGERIRYLAQWNRARRHTNGLDSFGEVGQFCRFPLILHSACIVRSLTVIFKRNDLSFSLVGKRIPSNVCQGWLNRWFSHFLFGTIYNLWFFLCYIKNSFFTVVLMYDSILFLFAINNTFYELLRLYILYKRVQICDPVIMPIEIMKIAICKNWVKFSPFLNLL